MADRSRTRVVTMRFSREGESAGVALDAETIYQVSVDGGPRSEFRPPWGEAELEEHIEVLRNESADAKPTIEMMKQLGMQLAEATSGVLDFDARTAGECVLHIQLDYPELASIPWELLTRPNAPHHHLLLDGVTILRRVSASVRDQPASWPTGRDETLRMLFVYSDEDPDEVPHPAHTEALTGICGTYGIELTVALANTVDDLSRLCTEKEYHFVHVLAHGALDDEDRWGLLFGHQVLTAEQVARAITVTTTPALVSLATCDSANDENNTFNSAAYHLHVHGIPLVWASQFKLRKSVSHRSAATLYEAVLGGEDILTVLEHMRRQLAPSANESWANEVIYSRYRHESLEELQVLSRQQAALRRARAIRKAELPPDEAIPALRQERDSLQRIARALSKRTPFDREAVAETYGLMGSLDRRIAALRGDEDEDLLAAAKQYEKGFEADRNSHYCGVNMIHLYLRGGSKGDRARALQLTPFVRYTAEQERELGVDKWALASLGELLVYEGEVDDATEAYRDYVDQVEEELDEDHAAIAEALDSPRHQMTIVVEHFDGLEQSKIREAAAEVIKVLDSALRRHTRD